MIRDAVGSTSATKSQGEYRASADLQKCGFCEKKLAGSAYMFVKLHRPPPDIRIFLPALLAWSISRTSRPRAAAVMAHISPAAPAPTMTTSVVSGRASSRNTASRRSRTTGSAGSDGSSLSVRTVTWMDST